MAGASGGSRFAARARALLAAALAVACASGDLRAGDGRYVHRTRGFSVPDVAHADPAWRRSNVPRTQLAYQRAGGAQLSLYSECGRTPTTPQVLARSLLIGLGAYVLRQSGPVAVGAFQGWSQVVDVEQDGQVRRIKTVTLLVALCSYDFLLVAGDDFESLEPGFDAWWSGFDPGVAAPAVEAAP
jgi:hypothetical protein